MQNNMRFIKHFLSFIIFIVVWITPALIRFMNIYFILATSILYLVIAIYLVFKFQEWFESKLK